MRLLIVISKILFFLNSVALLVAVLSPYIDPIKFWVPSVFGLFFKVFFLFALVFCVFFLVMKRWKSLIWACVFIIIGIPSLLRTVAFGREQTTENSEKEISIITYNTAGVNCCKEFKVDAALEVYGNLREQNTDLLFLQEFVYNSKCHEDLKELIKHNGYKYYYSEFGFNSRLTQIKSGNGVAVFSKYPLFNFKPLVNLSNTNNGAMRVDMKLGKDTIRLINVHLQSIGLQRNEYELNTEDLKENRLDDYKTSLRKIRDAFRKRSYQVEFVKSAILNSPYKVILCGDFNDTPISFTYSELTQKLDDTFLKAGSGFGTSFAGDIPLLRIDYTLASPSIKVLKSQIMNWEGSDHYALKTILAFP